MFQNAVLQFTDYRIIANRGVFLFKDVPTERLYQMDKLLKTGAVALLPALMGVLGAAAALMVPEFYVPFCRGIVSAVL